MIEHYKRIIRGTEKKVSFLLKNQILDEASDNYGGFILESELVQPKSTIYALTTMMALYYNKENIYFEDKKVFKSMTIALDYVSRQQREDGTFDYINCNFYAAPDTAFCLKMLLSSYKMLAEFSDADSEKFKRIIYEIIRKAAYGIAKGGFHTPNHRWAIAAALMACFNILGDETLKNTAQEYLSEGIDCNEYGEYAERSAGGYNGVNNDAMIMLAEETGDNSYLEYVNKNLNMMFTYIEPDGSIFTNNSTRQDRGKKVYPVYYYYQYLYMAHKTNSADFAAAANKIMEDVVELGLKSPDCLLELMIHPELINYNLAGCKYPENYKKYYKDSGIVRARRGDTSYSIVENSGRFLYFQAGELTADMRIGVTYFDQREFKIQKLEEQENGYVLYYEAKGWYYKPFKDKLDTSDWWKMDHSKREKIYGPDLGIVVSVSEIEEGLMINIKTKGCDRVPIKVEMCFSAGSHIKADGFMCEGVAGGAITAVQGNIKITKDTDSIEVGPAFGKHNLTGGYAGSEGRSKDHFTIYFTDFSNFEHTVILKKG